MNIEIFNHRMTDVHIFMKQTVTLCVVIVIFYLTYLDHIVTTLIVSIKFYTTFNVRNESPHYQKIDGYDL